MALKVGDVVVLKSGGAVMTVDSDDFDNNKVRCTWQNMVSQNSYTTEQKVFPIAALELFEDVQKRREKANADANDRLSAIAARMNQA